MNGSGAFLSLNTRCKSRAFHNFSGLKNLYLSNALVQKWKIREKRLCCLFFFKLYWLETEDRMAEAESNAYGDFPDNTDVMWMKMALMAASRAEVTRHAEGKPSVGCVIRRARTRGPRAVLAVGWNGFLANTPEEELAEIKGRTFKGDPKQQQKKRDKALTDALGLHAEVNALQYCSERPEMATIYTTHVPCYECAKQLVAHKVGRVFYLFWMEGSKTSIELFKKFDITCVPFGRRGEVLEDFSKFFLTKRKIVQGSTVEQTPIEPDQYFLDSRDKRHLENCITKYECKLS